MSHKFWVAESGLDTCIKYSVSEEIYFSDEDFGPNLNWYEVTVEKKEDEEKWIEARNNQLCARWTPNQDNRCDRETNRKIDEESGKIMDKLEVNE